MLILIYLLERYGIELPFGIVLSIAIILRIAFALKAPELSDDIYRYLWDGIIFNNGINPYAFTPIDIYKSLPEYGELFHKLNHNDFFTIYPPVSQLFFGISTYISKNLVGMKILLSILDAITCFFIYILLKSFYRSTSFSLLYAFNPLVVIEISGSGHIDGLGVFFLAFCMFLLSRHVLPNDKKINYEFSLKYTVIIAAISISFAFAVLTKLFPLVFLPLFVFLLPIKLFLLFFLVFMFTIIGMITVFYPDIMNMLTTLSIYTANWEFSNILFKILHAISNSAVIPRVILVIFFVACLVLIYKKFIPLLLNYSLNAFISACYYISFAFLVFYPTLHPWYGLYMILFLPFVMRIDGIVFSFSLLLLYRVMSLYVSDRIWFDDWFMASLVLLGPLASMCLSLLCAHVCRLPAFMSTLHDK
ncbi:MAG: hypothetical protein ABWK15_06050 [Dissulfuribacterales bacterium]